LSAVVETPEGLARVDPEPGPIAAVAAVVAAPPPLDYYLVFPESGDRPAVAQPAGLVVEEFVFAEDHSAAGLNSAGWTPTDGTWWSSAAFSRGMRADPDLRARVFPVDRDAAELAHHRLGGGALPDEKTLRARFHDYQSLAGPPPLRLGPPRAPDGYADKRLYRLLFAKALNGDGLAALRARWRLTLAEDFADPRSRVVGTAQLHAAGDAFTWDLRRIGPDLAWSVDVTAYLGGGAGSALGPLLRELRAAMRQQGLIPVTVERFS
jgi:hypothetical protein